MARPFRSIGQKQSGIVFGSLSCFRFLLVQFSRFNGSLARILISRSDGPPSAPLVTAMAKPSKASKARARKRSRMLTPPPFPWLRVYALRVLIALSIQRGLRAMRSGFLLAFFQRVQFPLSVSPYSSSYRGLFVFLRHCGRDCFGFFASVGINPD